MKEIDLVKQCQRNDARAQEQLYAQHAGSLYRLAFRYIKIQADAEDVLMTAFIKVFRNIATFRSEGDGSLLGWMRKIVINESLMWLRQRHNFNLTEALDGAIAEPDLQQFSTLEADEIYKMISDLPTGYRTIFNLHVVEGYSHHEIAGMLSITENTSRSQLFKAKTLLKKMLSQGGFQYGT